MKSSATAFFYFISDNFMDDTSCLSIFLPISQPSFDLTNSYNHFYRIQEDQRFSPLQVPISSQALVDERLSKAFTFAPFIFLRRHCYLFTEFKAHKICIDEAEVKKEEVKLPSFQHFLARMGKNPPQIHSCEFAAIILP